MSNSLCRAIPKIHVDTREEREKLPAPRHTAIMASTTTSSASVGSQISMRTY